ncbi:MAG: M24 family metallopeptidase, partial [Verrucomicrobia bacterium]|nr:M24 family metallopeptidase [Verrucomicrobiota bacterium]
MRAAGKVAGAVLEEVAAFIRPGATTKEIDAFAGECIRRRGAR